MSQRMNYNAASPAGMKALGAVYGYVRQSGLPSRLVDLVFLRVSQINGCAYCIDSHSRDLLKAGLPVEHLVLVATWPKSGSHLRRPGKGGARVGGSRDPPSRTHVAANQCAGRLLKSRRRGEVSARAA
jgi:AhpD family alkylhydroperoxidase